MTVQLNREKRKSVKKRSSIQTNFYLDVVIFAVFLVVMDPEITGLPIHEWLSLAFGGALIIHLVLHWKWVVAITKTFFKKLFHQSRLNYALNLILVVWFFVAVISGIMESQYLLPTLGLAASQNPFWENLHSVSAENLWFPVVLHLLQHWKWILQAMKRYLIPNRLWPRQQTARQVR